jgi:hypothetical protein
MIMNPGDRRTGKPSDLLCDIDWTARINVFGEAGPFGSCDNMLRIPPAFARFSTSFNTLLRSRRFQFNVARSRIRNAMSFAKRRCQSGQTLQQRALDAAIVEVNAKTDLKIKLASTDPSKHRRVIALKFTIKNQEMRKEQFGYRQCSSSNRRKLWR